MLYISIVNMTKRILSLMSYFLITLFLFIIQFITKAYGRFVLSSLYLQVLK